MRRIIFSLLLIVCGIFCSGAVYINGIEVFADLVADTIDVDTILGPVTIGDAGSTSHSLTANDDLFVSGKFEVDGIAYFDSTLNVPGTILGPVAIGDAGSTTHSLTGNDDLFVSGKFEVDSVAYFDSTLNLLGTTTFASGGAGAVFKHVTADTPDTMKLLTPTTSNAFLIAEQGDQNVDFAHALQTNPALFIQSSNGDDIAEWGGFSHDQTDFVIASGQGNITLHPAGLGLTVGDNSDNDFSITFDGDSSDGIINYDEDNADFEFDQDIYTTGRVQAADYYSGDGTQGMTDSTSFWLCTAADCATKCQVVIKDGLITSCS
jgi:hypothetical protein